MLVLVVVHPGSALGASSCRPSGDVGRPHPARPALPGPLGGSDDRLLPPARLMSLRPGHPDDDAAGPGSRPRRTPPRPPARVVERHPGALPANIAPATQFPPELLGGPVRRLAACASPPRCRRSPTVAATRASPRWCCPSNWGQLSPDQQIFVATNLERTVRGLPPLTRHGHDPRPAAARRAPPRTPTRPPRRIPLLGMGIEWAGAVGNPLEAMYFWMYDDGSGIGQHRLHPVEPDRVLGPPREHPARGCRAPSASWAQGGTRPGTAVTRA